MCAVKRLGGFRPTGAKNDQKHRKENFLSPGAGFGRDTRQPNLIRWRLQTQEAPFTQGQDIDVLGSERAGFGRSGRVGSGSWRRAGGVSENEEKVDCLILCCGSKKSNTAENGASFAHF